MKPKIILKNIFFPKNDNKFYTKINLHLQLILLKTCNIIC